MIPTLEEAVKILCWLLKIKINTDKYRIKNESEQKYKKGKGKNLEITQHKMNTILSHICRRIMGQEGH